MRKTNLGPPSFPGENHGHWHPADVMRIPGRPVLTQEQTEAFRTMAAAYAGRIGESPSVTGSMINLVGSYQGPAVSGLPLGLQSPLTPKLR